MTTRTVGRLVRAALLIAALLVLAAPLRAELRSFQVLRREPFAGSKAFGDTGPYEVITGIARFAVDPKQIRNRGIIDLELAPAGADGKVEFESDVYLLAPKDHGRGNGVLLYEVNNRGNKLALHFFNDAPSSNVPIKEEHAGNGFLFRRGYTVVWCGWSGEMLPGDGRLLLRAPVATDKGKAIRGLVRYEMSTDKPADSLPLSRREGHGSYAPTAEGEAKGALTWRQRETDPRVPIPRVQWSLERRPVPAAQGGVAGTLGQVRLRLTGGFRPGYLYELVCEAEGPIVQGLGFAAVRDLISFLRYQGKVNPLTGADGKPAIRRAHGFGVSQSGRFLRNFLYLGFNADEAGRRVFDGLMPHVAGGGLGFFNHRFAQPTRYNTQHEDHLYPTDYFPFTYGESTDPFSKRTDGILKRLAAENAQLLPKVMHTQSAAEYWHRSGSLVHTDPLGRQDVIVPEMVRVYAFGGTQHGPAAYPPKKGIADNLMNPGDYRPFLRALLEALDAWVKDGTLPPASVYPRIDRKTLVDWWLESTGFPALPGVRYPEVIQRPSALDYGPHFLSKGIIAVEPPKVLGNYVVLVPRSDPDGNDLGTLLPPEVAVPLATYAGWNLRRREAGAEAMLAGLLGSYLPFPATRAERLKSGDPRQSIQERYGAFKEYKRRFEAACQELLKGRYLLAEDARRLTERQQRERPRFAEVVKDAGR
jgi:hypothetical protein